MAKRALILFVALGLVAVSCGGTDEPVTPPVERSAPEASVLPPASPDGPGGEQGEQEPPENPDDGRLVVQAADRQLSTMLPDGSEVVELTDPGTINTQATWAPDGSRVAWVSVDATTGEANIATDRFDRSDFRQVTVDVSPFYLYWDPSAVRIAHLTATPAGLDLGVAEPFAEDGPTTRRIDRGQPYFFAWGPDGDELLVHASGFRLDRIDLGSATLIVDEFPAQFGSPDWLPDGTLVFADVEGEEQFLVTTGSSGEGRRPLVTYEGTLRFTLSNEANRIVMQALPPGLADDGIVTAGSVAEDRPGVVPVRQPEPTPTPGFDDSLDAIDPLEPLVPYVMGLFGGEPFPLSTQPAIALYPSPDGDSIAWLESSRAAPGAFVWRIDTGGITSTTPPFVPSEEMLATVIPFFDQYNLSHDYWSPSSNLFVFAGRMLDGGEDDGIWVFDRTTGTSTRIADGVDASFTRTPTAAGAASSL